MDLLSLGLDVAVIVGIILFTRVITGFDTTKKYEKYYVLIPLCMAFVVAFFVTNPLQWQTYGRNVVVYGPLSAYLFKVKKDLFTIKGEKVEQ